MGLNRPVVLFFFWLMLVVVVFSTYTHVHNTIVRVPYGSVMYWSITWVLGTELPVWFASGFVHAC